MRRSSISPLLARALMFGALLAAVPRAAHAENTFVARVDRAQVALGSSFIYEVTLSLESGRGEGYHAPDFRNFRVLGEHPSQSTQIQMGGGASFSRTVYSWRYELQPLQQGRFGIAPARVRAEGRDLKTEVVTITVGAGTAPSAAAPRPARRSRSPFDDLFGDDQPSAPPGEGGFIRVVPDKIRAYAGEQVVVEWFIYVTERPGNYKTVHEPRMDGFWSEDLAAPQVQGSIWTEQSYNGRTYLVAPLMRKALFPLEPGKLTITPMESEVAQVDFFGRALYTQRLKAEPVTIEAVPLPMAGRPAGFDRASVGRFSVEARLDRNKVGIGEAVTVNVAVSGQGNLRKLAPPRLPKLEGWKTYDPKVDVKLDNTSGIAGSKTIEYLLLPERPGVTMIPAFELMYFDPGGRGYVTEKTVPLRVEVTAEGTGAGKPGVVNGVGAPMAGVENVLPTEIRPPRAQPSLRRDYGTTFYRSQLFLFALVLPPGAFGLTMLIGRVREKLSQETERGRRRKTRRLVRQRLRAAEVHLDAGTPSPFYIEIDRVLREVLAARLGRPVTGLSRDELKALTSESGLGPELALRLVSELEECDRARFAPGSMGTGDMRAALDRAAELILQMEKAPVRPFPREVRA